MQHIRSTREVHQIVPSHHLAVEPRGEAWIPDGAPMPDGFELVGKPAEPKPPTKPELVKRAAELGVDVAKGATKQQIAEAIAAAEEEAALAAAQDEEQTDGVAGDGGADDNEPDAAAAETQEETD